MVRTDDERAAALRALGAEVVLGDLTQPQDVVRVLDGWRRVYFGMSVSPPYLEATVIMAAAALKQGNMEALVNMSQMTVSEMTLIKMTKSPQHRQHWLAEQALNWSGLPVVHVRPTVFLEHFFFSPWAAKSISEDGTIRLPFGSGHTSPIAAEDIARVIATILESPPLHIGKIYELTGPRSESITDMAKEYSEALGRAVTYVDMSFNQWRGEVLRPAGLPEHVVGHFLTMAELHAEGRYDRLSEEVMKVTGQPPMSVQEYVSCHLNMFRTAVRS